jgi:hypothetical protein
MKSFLFSSEKDAKKKAEEIGCEGTHKHKEKFMPCESHKTFLKVTKKKELEELIDYDGTLSSSKIPILDPKMTPKKTMDQTVAMARTPQDPWTRGFRRYYNENEIKEVDMSDAFGYEETKDMTAEECVKFLINKMGLDEDSAVQRCEGFGKTLSLDDKTPKDIKNKKNFVVTQRLTEKELSEEEVKKIIEDLVMSKSDSKDIQKKVGEPSEILKRNFKSVLKLAKKEGFTLNELFKMMRGE